MIPGDTAPVETVRVLAEGADVLVHEATFLEDERGPRRGHAALDGAAGRRRSRATPAFACSR